MDDRRKVRASGVGLKSLRSVLFVCLTAIGCGRDNSPASGVRFGIGGGVGSCTEIGDTAHIEAGATIYDVVVRDGKLIVNGRNYGAIHKGDTVIGTEHQLFINDKAASPIED